MNRPLPYCFFICALFVLNYSLSIEASEPTRILTYNIRYLNQSDGDDVWNNRKSTVCQTLQAADLIGLQEVVAQQLADIQAATPEHEWYGVGRDDGKRGGEMVPIGWRKSLFKVEDRGTFWLSETPDEVGKKGWDAALPRVATWVRFAKRPQVDSSAQSLLLINAHYDHMGAEARRESSRLLRRWIGEHRGDSLVVLLGDLNAEVGQPPLDELLLEERQSAAPLQDARETSPVADSGPSGTWNGFKAIAKGRRIDHILYQGEVKILTYTTLDPRTMNNRFGSDHLPIETEIAW